MTPARPAQESAARRVSCREHPVPLQGNIIPPNRLDNAFKVLMASPLYPQPTPSAPNSAVVLNGSQNNDDQEDFKVDFNASEKDRLFARYSRGKEIDPLTTSYLLGGNSSSEAHIDNTAFDETHTFTPSLLNDFRIGVNYVLPFGPNTTFAPSVATLAASTGIAGTTEGGISGLPNITFASAANNGGGIGNYAGLGNGAIIQKFASTVWQISDNVSVESRPPQCEIRIPDGPVPPKYHLSGQCRSTGRHRLHQQLHL